MRLRMRRRCQGKVSAADELLPSPHISSNRVWVVRNPGDATRAQPSRELPDKLSGADHANKREKWHWDRLFVHDGHYRIYRVCRYEVNLHEMHIPRKNILHIGGN